MKNKKQPKVAENKIGSVNIYERCIQITNFEYADGLKQATIIRESNGAAINNCAISAIDAAIARLQIYKEAIGKDGSIVKATHFGLIEIRS